MLCKIAKMVYDRTENPRIINLPKSEAEINALLQDMGIGRENNYEYAIPYIKTGNATLDKYLLENPATIDELNYVAGFLKTLKPHELERIGTVMEATKPANSSEFINTMHDHWNYTIFVNVNNTKELGEEIAKHVDNIDPDSPLGMCINFEEYGESYHDAHCGTFINGQYVVPPPDATQVYDGVMLPGTDGNDPNTLLTVQLISKQQFHEAIKGVDDVTGIWVKLPTTEYTLDRIADRLGEYSAENCLIYNVHSPVEILGESDCIINAGSSPVDVNVLAEVLSSYSDPAMMEKFEAVWEYEQYPQLPDTINIACNLDCYNYNPEIQSPEDFVIHAYGDDPVKLAQADDLDGEKLLARCGGKITELGFVARNDQPMEQVYEPPESEQGQDQGITMQ